MDPGLGDARAVRRLEQAFTVLGEEEDDNPCPAIQGIEKEGRGEVLSA